MTATYGSLIAAASARLRQADIDDANLEAQVLLAHAAGLNRSKLLAKLAESVPEGCGVGYDVLLDRRMRHEPLAYITGHREFYGIDIRCDSRALVPRPETEMLVDFALEELIERGDTLRIVDVGTGTGAIAVAITATNLDARVTALDASAEALRLAKGNVVTSGVSDRVSLDQRNLLEGTGMFDVVLANLPYISRADWSSLQPEVRDWEPSSALIAGERGTDLIEQLLNEAPPHLAPHGVLALEVGAGQASTVMAEAARCFPKAEIHARKDLAGIDRVVVVRLV